MRTGIASAFILPSIMVAAVGCWKFSHTSGRSIRISGSGDQQEIMVEMRDGQDRRKIHSKGRIVFSSDDREIVFVSAGGFLRIEHHTPEVRRAITILAGDSSAPRVEYREDGVIAERDDEANTWFVSMLDLIIHETSIGAQSRAERILRESGSRELLNEIRKLKRSAPQKVYLQTLLASPGMDAELLVAVSQVAANHVSSSATLSDTLSRIAQQHTEDEAVSMAIIEASKAVASSSQREDCLRALAQHRRITRPIAIAAIGSATEIDSDSSKYDALCAILAAAPADSETLMAYIGAVESISSANRQSDALVQLLAKDGLDVAVLCRAAQVAGKISSSNKQEDVLVALLNNAPSNPRVLDACLTEITNIPSSSAQEDVMEVLLEQPDLDKPTLRRASEVINEIPSQSARENLHQRVIQRLTD